MTSCGCFECIVAFLPMCNGVMIVSREDPSMTPCGMTFSTLAGTVGGGAQTPGFVGIGKVYIYSKKFISGDGGFERVVWMPKGLKETLKRAAGQALRGDRRPRLHQQDRRRGRGSDRRGDLSLAGGEGTSGADHGLHDLIKRYDGRGLEAPFPPCDTRML